MLREADEHRQRLSADITNPAHRDDLIFMFRQLGVLFLQMVDSELHSSYSLPEMPLADAANGSGVRRDRAGVAARAAGGDYGGDAPEVRRVRDVDLGPPLGVHRRGVRVGGVHDLPLAGPATPHGATPPRRQRRECKPRRRRARWWRRCPACAAPGGAARRAASRERRAAVAAEGGGAEAAAGVRGQRVVAAGSDWRVVPRRGEHGGRGVARVQGGDPDRGQVRRPPVRGVHGRRLPDDGKVFHSKNVATHGRPRAPGYRTSVFSRAHDNACEAFIALFTAGAASAEEVGKTVELQLPPPKPPPPPVPLEASEDDDDDAGPRRSRGGGGVETARRARASTVRTPAAASSRRQALRPAEAARDKPPSGDAPPRPRAISATQRLLEEAKGLVDEIEEEEDDGGRRKRPRRAAVAATAAGFADNGAAAAAAAALEDQDEEFLPCFCGTDRHLRRTLCRLRARGCSATAASAGATASAPGSPARGGRGGRGVHVPALRRREANARLAASAAAGAAAALAVAGGGDAVRRGRPGGGGDGIAEAAEWAAAEAAAEAMEEEEEPEEEGGGGGRGGGGGGGGRGGGGRRRACGGRGAADR